MQGNDRHSPPGLPAASSSPWRQPVVWLIVLLVAAAVAGGIAMVVIAAGDGAVDAVPDQVRRTAQVQVADLGPDENARRDGLSAIARIDAKGGYVEVLPVSGRFDRSAALRLRLLHPVRSSGDVSLDLQPGENGWRADADDVLLAAGAAHDWKLQLSDAGEQWRLRGRLPKGQQAAHLKPALPAP
jgi:hypothetical protein